MSSLENKCTRDAPQHACRNVPAKRKTREKNLVTFEFVSIRPQEIFSYIVDGELSHEDSMGNKESLGRGAVQYLSAGTGITHSEMNDGAERCRLVCAQRPVCRCVPKPLTHLPSGSFKFGSCPRSAEKRLSMAAIRCARCGGCFFKFLSFFSTPPKPATTHCFKFFVDRVLHLRQRVCRVRLKPLLSNRFLHRL